MHIEQAIATIREQARPQLPPWFPRGGPIERDDACEMLAWYSEGSSPGEGYCPPIR
jgi:hypothetical protein